VGEFNDPITLHPSQEKNSITDPQFSNLAQLLEASHFQAPSLAFPGFFKLKGVDILLQSVVNITFILPVEPGMIKLKTSELAGWKGVMFKWSPPKGGSSLEAKIDVLLSI
jgi:hypothetical protein